MITFIHSNPNLGLVNPPERRTPPPVGLGGGWSGEGFGVLLRCLAGFGSGSWGVLGGVINPRLGLVSPSDIHLRLVTHFKFVIVGLDQSMVTKRP